MGGLAMNTQRLSKVEYVERIERFTTLFKSLFPKADFAVTKTFEDKDTFGDIDFILNTDTVPNDWFKILKEELSLNKNEFSSTKWQNIIKFSEGAKPDVQIDFMLAINSNFEFKKEFYSFNGLVRLFNPMISRLGMNISQNGITYIIRDEDYSHFKEAVPFTKNYNSIFDILGLDKEVYLKGFETMEEAFQFVSSSRLFNPEIYKFENRLGNNLREDKKLKLYNHFLTWIENQENLIHFDYPFIQEMNNETRENPVKEEYKEVLFRKYPKLKAKHDKINYTLSIEKKFRGIFNARHIMEKYHLNGQALGLVMKQINQVLTFDKKEYFVKNNDFNLENFIEKYEIKVA